MELTFNQIDITGTTTPGDVLRRSGADKWYVPFKPYQPGTAVDWKIFRRDDNVFIPLVPYLSAPDPALSMSFMLQLGTTIALQLPCECERLHLAFGHPVNVVTQGNETFWQTHVGFGFLAVR